MVSTSFPLGALFSLVASYANGRFQRKFHDNFLYIHWQSLQAAHLEQLNLQTVFLDTLW